MYIWLCKDTGAMKSAPTPGGMFATHFVGGRCIINNPFAALRQTTSSRRGRFIVPAYTYSQRIRNPFEMPSRNVRNVFILCMLHIRYAKVWFLRHKSMVFWRAKNPLFTLQKPTFEMQYTKQRTRNNEVWYYI